MNSKRIIPVTPILKRYRGLRKSNQAERLAAAKHDLDRPCELAAEFAESVEHFSSYENVDHPFYPDRKPHQIVSQKLQKTNDLVLRLEDKKTETITPADALGRRTSPPAAKVVSVAAKNLGFDYVDRELLVQRTKSPAAWEDGRKNGGGTRLDILLADHRTRSPIVAELKLPGDMDPYFALIQALTCAAHLATPSQHARLARHLPDGRFEGREDPRLGVFVLFVEKKGREGEKPRGRYMPGLHDAATQLAPTLLEAESVNRSVRRIAALTMGLDGADLRAHVRWAWEQPLG